jgi:hypothetical protein
MYDIVPTNRTKFLIHNDLLAYHSGGDHIP